MGLKTLRHKPNKGLDIIPSKRNEKLGSEVPCIQMEICQHFLFSRSGSSIYRSIWAGAFLILLGTAHRSGLLTTFHNISQYFTTFHNDINDDWNIFYWHVPLHDSHVPRDPRDTSCGHQAAWCLVGKPRTSLFKFRLQGYFSDWKQIFKPHWIVPVQNHGPWGIYLEMVVSSPQDGRF